MAQPVVRSERYVEGHPERPFAELSWGAILAGVFLVIAFGLLLNSLWAAIGLTTLDAGEALGIGSAWWTGIWSFLSIIIATFVGAMLASRASLVYSRIASAVQGGTIWALSLLVMLAFTAYLGSAMAEATGTAAAGAAPQIAQQLEQVQGQIIGQQGAETAQETSAAVSWWFFLSALFGAGAGMAGGVVGAQAQERRRYEVTRTRTATEGAVLPREREV